MREFGDLKTNYKSSRESLSALPSITRIRLGLLTCEDFEHIKACDKYITQI